MESISQSIDNILANKPETFTCFIPPVFSNEEAKREADSFLEKNKLLNEYYFSGAWKTPEEAASEHSTATFNKKIQENIFKEELLINPAIPISPVAALKLSVSASPTFKSKRTITFEIFDVDYQGNKPIVSKNIEEACKYLKKTYDINFEYKGFQNNSFLPNYYKPVLIISDGNLRKFVTNDNYFGLTDPNISQLNFEKFKFFIDLFIHIFKLLDFTLY